MSQLTPTIGGIIRACRQERKLSARSLSLKAGLSDSVVGKVEDGTIAPSLRVFARIVTALELRPQEVAVLVALAAVDPPELGVENSAWSRSSPS